MHTTTLRSALASDSAIGRAKQCVYVVRDGNAVLYVGKVESCCIRKRFEMHLGLSGPTHTPSKIGTLIHKNAPDSDQWQIEIYTVEDCNEFLAAHGATHRVRKVNTAERALIHYFHPSVNIQSNPSPQQGSWQKHQRAKAKHANRPAWVERLLASFRPRRHR